MKNKLRYTIVGGTWDDNGGRPSGYVTKLAHALANDVGVEVLCQNGGSYNNLERSFTHGYLNLMTTDVLLWWPDVPNDKEKMVEQIKRLYPKVLLVTSKNNRAGKYSRHELVARALSAKANLLVEMTEEAGGFGATVIDPLGNVFLDHSTEIGELAEALAARTFELKSFTRVGSARIGPSFATPVDPMFLELAHQYAEQFHTLVHAANQDRLLGNLSFRCEGGFPSSRVQGLPLIRVSRRNIDKRDIQPEGFVGVLLHDDDDVKYFGDVKPSVDTPIQAKLYKHFPNVNYMLHAHVYVAGAPFTASIVPCGALEEFDEIVALFPDPDVKNFAVNLRGHGSIVFASSPMLLRGIAYEARP